MWTSAETLYQALKFEDLDYCEEIRLTSIDDVWTKGQTRQKAVIDGFFDVKQKVMKLVQYTRISQHPVLEKLLLRTEGDILFPESDDFWGTDFGGGGSNWNGRNLMAIRKHIKS